ncbi:MAG TPA: GNAT family protein [Sphingobacteriaceae bacterium]
MILNVNNITEEDLATRVRWINDPRVNQYMYFIFPVNSETTAEWFNRVNAAADRQDLVFKDEDGQPVGMAGLTAINPHFSNTEFYIFIDPDLQGKGIGKAITSWMLDYAFSVLKVYKVYLYTDGDNLPGIRMYENLGFVKEGHQRRHRLKNGKFHDKLIYGIFNDEWKKHRKRKDCRHTVTARRFASVV